VAQAVLFDWSNTLVEFNWDDELLVAGHRAGLAAIGREEEGFTERYREVVLPQVGVGYGELLRELLGELSDAEVDAYVDAEHEVWRPAHRVLASAQALLESIRSRGVKTGIVANSWPEPPRVLWRDIEEAGLAALLDVVVFSADVGALKPQPEIFLHALDRLGVAPEDAMFVGDRLATDIQGAGRLGLTTVQAMWFHADDGVVGVEPDFMAFTPMDVLNALRRLSA
jgi:HAD superfamily hydrolase (TIGR01509 family)